MNSVSYSFSKFIGIEVSKNKLDIASAAGQAITTIGNSEREINAWIQSLGEETGAGLIIQMRPDHVPPPRVS